MCVFVYRRERERCVCVYVYVWIRVFITFLYLFEWKNWDRPWEMRDWLTTIINTSQLTFTHFGKPATKTKKIFKCFFTHFFSFLIMNHFSLTYCIFFLMSVVLLPLRLFWTNCFEDLLKTSIICFFRPPVPRSPGPPRPPPLVERAAEDSCKGEGWRNYITTITSTTATANSYFYVMKYI